ncbi:DUF410-domain-containing protein [Eremomyces bilateralis CBS 781.70]|uniref:DUF410-domain-containing protein n=1 Tax=Eremomyces bilateralis CBS 781.70 TaxID=1392243 RepID=A0A6G1G5M5_9PEZI|nr:DUF410-domain-containing protein [Eremomyces bilateralis CBS 781.70]KAF1813363.1 DUF410-domain-containing protein [Eremomyces bilateralis CBS 781.70]
MASKIEKTIARQKEKIEEGQYYEAHQQLRVIAARYIKQTNYDAAADILASGAGLLLKAGQGGSGGDLCLFLLDVWTKGEKAPDAASRAKLVSLLRTFPPGEPTMKRFVNEMMVWSSKFGEYPAGDPELHHVAGTVFAEASETYDAERHFILGTKESPEQLIRLEYEWFTEDASHTAPLYAARAVLPYLLIGNIRAANQSLLLFTSRLSTGSSTLAVQEVSTKSSDLRVYPSLPLLNFLGLLLLAVQRGAPDLFKQLKSHYAANLKEVGMWDEALAQIGEIYFGIKIPSQSNPLFDMMGNMFNMGGMGQGRKKEVKGRGMNLPAPPTPGLD